MLEQTLAQLVLPEQVGAIPIQCHLRLCLGLSLMLEEVPFASATSSW